ncbi:hypothetical protein PSTT_12373 [Puccinia striiformis]|uniref:Integrase catalytic domain-containing protein n=1 Tax=Puccinia striiformis TaxID=27350 RepID=A0A2S4UWH8_9BASI|nr:hypothetical protein PSTT_12373 [Puccinia striiformis]
MFVFYNIKCSLVSNERSTETLMSSNNDDDNKLPKNPKAGNQTPMSKTTDSSPMDRTNTVIFETLIKATPLLTDDNFSMWKSKVLAIFEYLSVKKVFTKGEGQLSTEIELVLRMLLLSKLDEKVHKRVINPVNEEDTLLIWKSIIDEFASNEAANQERIWNEFAHLPFDNSDVQGFITQLKSLLIKMHEVGISIPMNILSYEILNKFPPTTELTTIATTIKHCGTPITPTLVLYHLKLYADNLASSSKVSKPQVALFTDEFIKCKPGSHNPKAHHPYEQCWKVFPHLNPYLRSNSTKGTVNRSEISVSSFLSSLSSPFPHFVLDSGSSAHMTSNLNLFTSMKLKEEGVVKTSSGSESLKIKGSGTIKLSNQFGDFSFSNVLFVPDLVVNLLSVRCLVLDGYNVSFEKNMFTITKENQVSMRGEYRGNLPCLEFCNHHSHLTADEELHKSLGHNPMSCEACAVSKITKGSFHTRHSQASKPFEELHLDLVGPISPTSRGGHRYFMTVVDSCTRFVAAIPLKRKSDATESIIQAINLEAKRFGYYPTVIHSDRGTEFINSHLTEFCKLHSIRSRQSDAYTPQQNGLAERFNRTILESMRAIFKDSGLRKDLWHEIVKSSALTLNQIPAHRSKKPPYELFKNRSLPLKYFKPVGIRLSYLILPELTGSKLAPKETETEDDASSEVETSINEDEFDSAPEAISESADDDAAVSSALIPETRSLRDRTSKIKPVKYSYLTGDPTSFKMAMRAPNKVEWVSAVDQELDNIEGHDVWDDMYNKPNSYLRTVWIFKTKPATPSSLEKKKGRLCIQGFLQIPGEQYGETFAPTGKFTSLLILLLFALDKKLPIRQFDVKSAFLFAPLDEELYIRTPEGSKRTAPFLRLKKSLYGLKQAPANWYKTLTSWFIEINFHQSAADPCLFIHNNKDSFIFFHVDDLVVVGQVNSFEKLFLTRFPNSSAHDPDSLLGMELTYDNHSVQLSQKKLIEKGLELAGIQQCRPASTPLSVAIQLQKATDQERADFSKLKINYRSHTGILNFLACRTRPDLAPAVSILSSFNEAPGINHWRQIVHCWKYLAGTIDLKLSLRPDVTDQSNSIQHFTDATWADDLETRLSRSGSICFWKACPVAWNSKKQRNITMSSTEAELNALSDGVQENHWIKFLVEELYNDKLNSTVFHIDNQGLLEKIKNFGSNSKTKHLDIKMKYLRDLYSKNEISVKLIPSEDMIADALTKASTAESLNLLKEKCFYVELVVLESSTSPSRPLSLFLSILKIVNSQVQFVVFYNIKCSLVFGFLF